MTKEHTHDEHYHEHGGHSHGHSHGKVDVSIIRSKEGVKAVSISFLVLFIAALLQLIIFNSGKSVALLSDLIHNMGDALTAIPLGMAFYLRNKKYEKWSGYFVVFLIFVSACVTLYEVIDRFIHPQTVSHLWAVFVAGIIGVAGNELAAVIRTRAGKHLHSPALIADGKHAHVDGIVSVGVVISTVLIALGFPVADPIVGLIITVLILRITWQSWQTIRASD